jgi:hypothetical protein
VRFVAAVAAAIVVCFVALSCGKDDVAVDPDAAPPPIDVPAASTTTAEGPAIDAATPNSFVRRFPTSAHPGVRVPGCLFASPLADGDRQIVAAHGGGAILGLDPLTGAELWSRRMPAPVDERPMIVATPVIVGRRAVVAYHTTPEGPAAPTVLLPRLRHRVAVVDLDTHALDPAFPVLDLTAAYRGPFGDVVFRPSHALGRGALVHVPGGQLGRVYLTFGNARDLQPFHGWIFEVDLDSWKSGTNAITALPVTADVACGPEDGDGADEQLCGGGIWSAAGPTLDEAPDAGPFLLVPTGNGQLDLDRGDYASTLMRVGAGLAFAPGCDPAKCTGLSLATLGNDCAETCRDLFIPRVLPNETKPAYCTGMDIHTCWARADFLDGASSPVVVPLASGKRVVVYPTKDGHVWLLDRDVLGRAYAHVKLTELCGADNDYCAMPWAGTIVTKPALTHIGGDPVVLVPTFVADTSHAAGVFALRIVERAGAPALETVWRMPEASDPSATTRFRDHPSRLALGDALGESFGFIVDATRGGLPGRLLAIRVRDGARAAETALVGPGMRFSLPLFVGGAIFVGSCASDGGEGFLEGYELH